ncbi:unnamed protein product [Boreogadus saida]
MPHAPQRPDQLRSIWGLKAATRPARLDPIWPLFPAISPYFSGAAAEPVRLGAPVKAFIQFTKTEGLTDRGYRAVPPLDPALCAVFGVKPGLSDRCPTPKDQLTAKLTDRGHRAVDVAKTAGVILCLCSIGAVAAARTAAWQHLIQRNLWLQQTPGIPEPISRQLLECPISPDVLFGPRLSSMVDDMQAASEEAEEFRRHVSRHLPPPGQQRSAPSSRRRHRPPAATVAAPPSAPPPGPQAYQPRPPPSQAAVSGQQRPRAAGSWGDVPPHKRRLLRGEGEACDSEKHLFTKDGCFLPVPRLTPEPTGSPIPVSHASSATYGRAVNTSRVIGRASPSLLLKRQPRPAYQPRPPPSQVGRAASKSLRQQAHGAMSPPKEQTITGQGRSV